MRGYRSNLVGCTSLGQRHCPLTDTGYCAGPLATAAPAPGEALVGEALVGEALVGEALVGEALVGEALVGGDALVGE